jgi:hypothetical protein
MNSRNDGVTVVVKLDRRRTSSERSTDAANGSLGMSTATLTVGGTWALLR